MNYSPKLKKAMAEIKAIADKYDIAAAVVLHVEGFSEYLLKIDPTWSIAKLDLVANKITIRAKSDDHRNKKALFDKLRATSNMFKLMADTSGILSLTLIHTTEEFDSLTKTIHVDSGHTSQESLDN